MTGRVNDGQLVTVVPIDDPSTILIGDVVLCKVRGAEYLHLVKGVENVRGKFRFLIGNNKGSLNGWTNHSQVYGKCVKVEP